MSMNIRRAHEQLARGNLLALFVEDLGWDRHTAKLRVSLEGSTFELHALAQKRGMVAFQCPTPPGQRPPDYRQRRRIEQQVAQSALEHLIVFTDATSETQIWQWVKREPGRPVACREHTYRRSQPGDSLLQKLGAIAFTLDEEERLALPDVTQRARAGFDVERVTKRFYEQFQKEHEAFIKLISGIDETPDREWYASVMLNRLMFVYFIQRKGFLAGDRDYLRNRLVRMGAEHGKDRFYSFYRYFLLRLFHEGLGGRKRAPELEALLGRIPYLNGGLFDVHELEKSDRYGKSIQIPDRAFERIFTYFDQYQWHLDERPLRADNEINPDVLGYIFEKYINQKQMGAYYTKEDITEYISKNTVLPFIFDTARAKCKIAFVNLKGSTVWDLLRDDPDRYIYSAVRHGAGEALPRQIAVGVNPPTLNKAVGDGPVRTIELRKDWNKPAPATHGLPTEIWREVIGRLTRYEEIKAKLAGGDVHEINDLVTLNLDIRQFAQDAIENCEGPDLLRAFWQAIEKVTILDPTCGSGAFLFAALNILEPLYEACLERMEAFVEDLARSGERHRPEKFSDFRRVLERVAGHPNRRYFIFKSIILNNLFGVDIMEEAVEICKLRLFLKLAAQVEPDTSHENLGIEPLPDIDFNIRAGNTLVGYATLESVKRALSSRLDFEGAAERIEVKAADLQQSFDAFRARQVEGSGTVPSEDKSELRRRLAALGDELNRYLAGDYNIELDKKGSLSKWLRSHQPFHWFVEFYGIMRGSGFDVIIGNPPYVEYSKVKDTYQVLDYSTEDAGNIYTLVLERAIALSGGSSRIGMIVPSGGFSTARMRSYQDLMCSAFDLSHVSFFSGDANPSRLFEGVKYRLAIFLGRKGTEATARYTTKYIKWYAAERTNLFSRVAYERCSFQTGYLRFAKLGDAAAAGIAEKLASTAPILATYLRKSTSHTLHYHRSPVSWIRAMDFQPYFKSATRTRSEDHLRDLHVESEGLRKAVGAILNSTHFFFWFITQGTCRDIAGPDVESFPVGDLREVAPLLGPIFSDLMTDLKAKSRTRVYHYKASGRVEYQEFYPGRSKQIIDKIDKAMARGLGLVESELDFILNFDIKYRMGSDTEHEDEQ